MDFHLRDIPEPSGENENPLLFENFMENSPVPAWISGPEGVIHYANPSFRKLFTSGTAPVVNFNQGFFLNEPAESYARKLKQLTETKKPLIENHRMVEMSGAVSYYRVVRFLIMHRGLPQSGGWAFNITREKKWHDHALELKKNKRKEMLRLMIEARENEREAIATQLRDSISQTLAFCSLTVQDAIHSKSSYKVSAYIHQAIEELNRISWTLSHSVIIDFGLQEGVRNYIEYLSSVSALTVKIDFIQERIETIAISDKIAVFRIIQNYLLLLAGNSKPAEADVLVEYFSPMLKIQIRFSDPTCTLDKKKEEFIDMKLRIDYYDGHLSTFLSEGFLVTEVEYIVPAGG